jgi:hypothetical protein
VNQANFFPPTPPYVINEEISISERFKKLRRMSAIVRKTSLPENQTMSGGEESNEVQGYLEDLRSHRNSPLDGLKDQNTDRIIEENEDDSSSS